jgi:hypothetical protein
MGVFSWITAGAVKQEFGFKIFFPIGRQSFSRWSHIRGMVVGQLATISWLVCSASGSGVGSFDVEF